MPRTESSGSNLGIKEIKRDKRMKKISLFAAFLFLALPISTYALSFTFGPISDEGGTGTATMDIQIDGSTLTASINNTSPVDLDGGSDGGNSPGITGFGFELDPETLALNSWTLSAFTNSSSVVTIGSNGVSGLDWVMDNFLAGINIEYLPNNGGVADGALFNPSAFSDINNTLPGGQNDVYYTTATLIMNFGVITPILNTDYEWSPFVRMQNVGIDGEGSLKLPGTSVPDAAIMLLLGPSLIILGLFSRKKSRT
jgi:hypothetical protein